MTDTQIESLQKTEGMRPGMRAFVYSLFERLGNMTDTELTEAYRENYSFIQHSSMVARRNELVEAKRLVRVGKKKNPISGINNIIWGIPTEKTEVDRTHLFRLPGVEV